MTMLERMAAAIDGHAFGPSFGSSERTMKNRQKRAIEKARAALMAIREPNEAMKSGCDEGCGCPCCAQAYLAFPSIIDAILSEKPE